MGGPYLKFSQELGHAVRGKWEATVDSPGSYLAIGNSPVARQKMPPLAALSGPSVAVLWAVFEPPPLPATEEVGPGIGI